MLVKEFTIEVWNWLTCKHNRPQAFISSFRSWLCPGCVRNPAPRRGPESGAGAAGGP